MLGLVLLAGVLTGLGANTIGIDWPLDLIQLHAASAIAIVLLAPWKYVVIRRGLRRRSRGWGVKSLSLALLVLVCVAIASGLIHSTGHLEHVGPLTLMQIHVGAAVTALAVLVARFASHAVRPRRADADRRALSYGHGYPARIVAPGRRGFWWVKWVASVQPSMRPPWAQSVFPLT
jgi:hypothetical protein